ncbi:MAG: carboxypeptidase-like regulatory domain-containing protein, partial [Rikenellaceae bacterium]
MKSLLITIVIILTTLDTNAQIRGIVLDENSDPLPGAVIVLVNNADSAMIASTASGDGGVFSFENIANGSQLLNVFMLGYAPITLPVKSDMGKISMTVKTIEMKDVTVKGAAFTSSSDRFTFTISNPALIAGNDAVGILKLTPLLQANDSGVSIIGASTTKLYVNGKEVKLAGTSLGNYLKGIPAEDVVKIEVMPVANSTFKGQGNFGV